MTAILSRIASLHGIYSLTDATKQIRKARQDGLSLPAGRQDDLARQLREIHQEILAKREARSRAKPLASFSQPSLRSRMSTRTIDAVRDAVCGLYRVSQSSWAGGDHSTVVKIGSPAASGSSSRAWSKNGKWSGNNSRHDFTVPLAWIPRVQSRDLTVVDGMLTLDAEPV